MIEWYRRNYAARRKNNGPVSRFRQNFNQKMARYRLNGDFILTMGPALLLVLLLGQTVLLFPFRLFTTLAHETGHMIAALALGVPTGQIILMGPYGGGLTQVEFTQDTTKTIIIGSAGYLGSTLFGGLILLLAKRPQRQRMVMFGMALVLLLIMVLFVHNISGIFVYMLIIFTLAIALRGPDLVVAFSLYTLALLSCFNSISDLLYLMKLSEHSSHDGTTTDVVILQTYTGVPATTWALSWSLISAFMLVFFVLNSLFVRRPRPAAAPVYPAPPVRAGQRPNNFANQPYYNPPAPVQPAYNYSTAVPQPVPARPAPPPPAPVSEDDQILLQNFFSRLNDPSNQP